MHDGDTRGVLNAGCRTLEVEDPVRGERIAVRLLHPTRAPARRVPFGPFTLELALDAPVEGSTLPLVLLSHGSGGTPWTHRDLAAHLARSGFVVALLQHPGNHRGDNRLVDTVDNLRHRPRHVRLAIDAAFADARVGPHLAREGVAVIGHSMGGYTALAVAGGQPGAAAGETPTGEQAPVDVEHDARVRALVLLAPATPWFMREGSLAGVRVPIQLWTGEKDTLTGPPHAGIVERGLRDPRQLEHRVVPGAGHFAFLSAYPPELRSPAIPPSQDPEGFDREAFLPGMFAEIVDFLRRVG